jgi:hypothetical protein
LVTFRLVDPVKLGALSFDVDYAALDGTFLENPFGQGQRAECVQTSAAQSAAFNAGTDTRVFRAAFISSRGFRGPVGLAHCRYSFEVAPPEPSDFAALVTDASTPQLCQVLPRPTVVVSSVQCPADSATTTTITTTTTVTTTTSTTTTTLPPPECGDPIPQTGSLTATDVLFILRVAVGQFDCPLCVCDANGSGTITASDARRVLLAILDPIEFELNCPACSAARASGVICNFSRSAADRGSGE